MHGLDRDFARMEEFYRDGPFRDVVAARRPTLPRSADLFMVKAPRGSYPKPPTADFNLCLTVGTPHRANLDFGAGRWRKLLVPGDLALQPPNIAADISTDDDHEVLIVSLPDRLVLRRLEELGEVATDFGALHAAAVKDGLVTNLCQRLWTESEEGSGLGAIFIDTVVTLLVTLLAGLAHRHTQRPLTGGLSPRRFRQVVEHIHAHLADDLRLEELATTGGISASHLVRTFRKQTGVSPHQYIVRARVDRARQLLADTDWPVSDVAKACGFATSAHLATWFRRLVGVAPSEFRKRV